MLNRCDVNVEAEREKERVMYYTMINAATNMDSY